MILRGSYTQLSFLVEKIVQNLVIELFLLKSKELFQKK